MNSSPPSRYLVLSALIAVQVLFGINYVVSKVVVGAFPPLVWASIRIAISTVVMFGFAFASGRPHPKYGRKFFVPLIVFALLGTIINQSTFLVGLKYTTSTNSAILNTLIPIFTLLIVTLRGQEAATSKRILGFVFALAGVLVLRKVEELSFSDQTAFGDFLTIINCLSYALFLAYGKKFMSEHDPIWTTCWLFLYGTVGLTLLAIPQYRAFHMPVMTTSLWAAAGFAVIGATLLTYFLNFWALAYARSSHVALFIYLQPVVTSAIALLWLGEAITLRTALASGLIFCGMLLGLTRAEAPVRLAAKAVS